MNNTTTFAPGRYLVHGEWNFHIDLREDGSGVWTNLDGAVLYRFVPGEVVEFLEGWVREGREITPVN